MPSAYARLLEEGIVTTATVFRPPHRGPVLVVAATDPVRAKAVLSPTLTGRLCVVRSRHTARCINGVRKEVKDNVRKWQAFTVREISDELGQLAFVLEVVLVAPELAEAAGRWPDDLVYVYPWVAPSKAT